MPFQSEPITMLGRSRLTIRQATELAEAGRIEEAFHLIDRPEIADHRGVIRLRSRLVDSLLARSRRRAAADDLDGALDDLQTASGWKVPPDRLAEARQELSEIAARELQFLLDSGQPGPAVQQHVRLSEQKIPGESIRRSGLVAQTWRHARSLARRGEFDQAQERFESATRLASDSARMLMQNEMSKLEARQQVLAPLLDRLHGMMLSGDPETLRSAAQAVLKELPDHELAQCVLNPSRGQSPASDPGMSPVVWVNDDEPNQPSSQPGDEPEPITFVSEPSPNPESVVFIDENGSMFEPPRRRPDSHPGQRSIPSGVPDRRDQVAHRVDAVPPVRRLQLWIDGVGSYLVCLDDQVTLGRSGHRSQVDIPLLGDLSSRHAAIYRSADVYILQALGPCQVGGREVRGSTTLQNGDRIRLGSSIEMRFVMGNPASVSARLDVLTPHRLPLAVDGILLMAETAILGETSQAHIQVPRLSDPLVLYRQGGDLWCRRKRSPFVVNDQRVQERAHLGFQGSIRTDEVCMNLEPLIA